MTLPLFLSTDRNVPLNERLIEAIKEAIATARLVAGAEMPSSRELAVSLNISRSTVSKAYMELNRTGVLISRPGGKTYVAPTKPEGVLMRVRAQPTPGAGKGLGRNLINDYANSLLVDSIRQDWGHGYAAAPKSLVPTSAWKQVLTQFCNELDDVVDMSSHALGEPRLREAIAQFLSRTRGLMCTPDHILALSDSQSGLSFIAQLLVNPGDTVVVEEPCHVNARNLFIAHGAAVLPIAVDEEGMRTDLLAESVIGYRKIKLIYVSPSFQDPTGVCMSLSRRQHLLSIAAEHDALIVEDSWDGSHVYLGLVPPPLHTLSREARVIYLCSVWKILYPLSLACFLVLPPDLIPVFEQAKRLQQEANVAQELMLARFIEQGHLHRHLKYVTRKLAALRQQKIEELITAFGQSVHIRRQSAAFWLSVVVSRKRIDQFITTASARGWVVLPSKPFHAYVDDAPENEFLVSFAHSAHGRDEASV